MFEVNESVLVNTKGEKFKQERFYGVGRLTSNPPEIRDAKGYKVMSHWTFSLAVDAGKDKTEFFQLVAWGKTAENLHKLGEKGMKITVFGKYDEKNSYEKDGKTIQLESPNKIVTVDKFNITFEGDNNSSNEGEAKVDEAQVKEGNFDNIDDEIDDDDIPF